MIEIFCCVLDHCTRKFVALTKKLDSTIASVFAVDLNNDNRIDIVSIDETNEFFDMVFNLGNDKFDNPVRYSFDTDALPESIVLADINNDGYIDILVGLAYFSVRIYLNTNDDQCDIIVIVPSKDAIGVYLNKNNLTFTTVKAYTVGVYPMSAVAIDLNGDKKSDIIVANTKSNTISILYNEGEGTFSRQNVIRVDMGPMFVTAAKLNNDDKPDIIVVHYFSSNVVIFLNNGNKNFTRQTNLSDLINPLSVAIADYNNDGTLDIIVPHYHSNYVGVFFNDGNGMFGIPSNYITYPLPRGVAVADINDDNKPDIIIGAANYVGVILSQCY
jgi:hypothetical protein